MRVHFETRTLVAVLVGVATLAALPLACSSDDPQRRRLAKLAGGCALNSDCEAPLVCAFELCHEQCRETRDCPDGQRCVRTDDPFINVCQLPEEKSCSKTGDCKGKQICTPDGECRDVCTQDTDCVLGQICTRQSGCAEPSEVDPDRNINGTGGGGGTGGSGGSGGSGGIGGSGGSGGTGGSGGSGGSGASGGSGGTGGVGGADASVGGTGGTAGTGAVGGTGGVGGTAGTAGSSGTGGGAGSGGSAGLDGGAGSGGADASTGGSGGSGGCAAGTADCDNDGSCETALNLLTSCGACDTICDPTYGDVTCNQQTLTCEVKSCKSGRGDCDNVATNGCEVDVNTASAHCGTCGHSCLGGNCAAGLCQEVTIGSGNEGHQAALGADAVWVMSCGNSACSTGFNVIKFPKDGSGASTLFTGSLGGGGIALDGTGAWFGVRGNPSALYKVPTGSTTPAPVFTTTKTPWRLAANGTYVFIVTTGGEVVRYNPDGSGETVLASGQGNNIYEPVATATTVYWIALSAGTVWDLRSVPAGGGAVTVVEALNTATHLTVNGGYVYYNTRTGSALDKLARHSPSGGVEVLAQGQQFHTVGTDGTTLFYTLWDGSNTNPMYAKPMGTGLPTVITPSFAVARIFGADATHVYWTGSFNKILKVAK